MRDLVADLCADEPAGDPWWLLVLISELPDDCATAASMSAWLDARPHLRRGERSSPERDYRGWGHDRHLLAAIFDAIQANTVATARVAGVKKVKQPKPWPRPGSSAGGSSHSGMTSMRSLLAAKRAPAEGSGVI